ncbi:MAG: sulfide/dihydroorotate dehydrogenase-like FAD/NAD-binding protein [Ruminococcus sp.]|nr:sulfide/dihydroorotate dehydrogenase-like FAD/NAD-binding protein [Ruminococcus sp.]
MYKIVTRKQLNENVVLMEIDAPFIAAKAEAGQFIIYRVDEQGERVPLTIADYDREKGTITIIFQVIGGSTTELAKLNEGDFIHDVVGPLGVATEYEEDAKRIAVVGGGVGCAIAYPQAKKLHNMGVQVDLIAGFRNKDIVILEDEMKAASTDLHICTDDGSYGYHGFVTNKLQELIDGGAKFDEVIAIGPVPMMKFVCKVTEPYGIKTLVSLNPIMIDGTGMCGGCRVTVDGKIKYACVDGPDFDGHKVDFDELMRRNATYKEDEKAHVCRLTGGVR